MRPSIFLTAEKIPGLRSFAEVQESINHGLSKQLWKEMLDSLHADMNEAPYTPFSEVPGRRKVMAEQGNRDYIICDKAGQRIMYAALAGLITGKQSYVDEALKQLECVFDRERWGEWRDRSHGGCAIGETPTNIIDLRTGMFARDISLAYDWMYEMLTETQRQWIVAGLDEWAFYPLFKGIEEDRGCLNCDSNWLTVVVGGVGIAAMILGDDYARSKEVFEYSWTRMVDYLGCAIGPKGESNESPAYAGSTQNPVIYFETRRYQTNGEDNRVGNTPFPQHCHWMMNMTVPPGYIVKYGDGGGKAPMVPYFAAVASASRDPIIQWFYLNHLGEKGRRNVALELLWYDDSLEAKSPEGILPKGDTFPAFSGCIASRTDWNPDETASVVMSKAGHSREGHGNNDAGQVCIDAFGKPLIVDLGNPPYPKDFFSMNRWKYYPASVVGHNVLQFDQQEMRTERGHHAEILDSEFNDAKGGWWSLDTTELYDNVKRVKRTVVHLFPGIVAVYDEAALERTGEISLRWHTFDRAEPDNDGSFVVVNDGACLVSRIVRLDQGTVQVQRKQHAYHEPFHMDRNGEPLEQKHESYVEADIRGDSCRILTLFAALKQGDCSAGTRWVQDESGFSICAEGIDAQVTVADSVMRVRNQTTQQEWVVALGD